VIVVDLSGYLTLFVFFFLVLHAYPFSFIALFDMYISCKMSSSLDNLYLSRTSFYLGLGCINSPIISFAVLLVIMLFCLVLKSLCLAVSLFAEFCFQVRSQISSTGCCVSIERGLLRVQIFSHLDHDVRDKIWCISFTFDCYINVRES
jgi:hypothetical protein